MPLLYYVFTFDQFMSMPNKLTSDSFVSLREYTIVVYYVIIYFIDSSIYWVNAENNTHIRRVTFPPLTKRFAIFQLFSSTLSGYFLFETFINKTIDKLRDFKRKTVWKAQFIISSIEVLYHGMIVLKKHTRNVL